MLLTESGDAVAQLPREMGMSPSLEVFQNCGDVALRDVDSGHGGVGWWLELMFLEVFFSNQNDSIILLLKPFQFQTLPWARTPDQTAQRI